MGAPRRPACFKPNASHAALVGVDYMALVPDARKGVGEVEGAVGGDVVCTSGCVVTKPGAVTRRANKTTYIYLYLRFRV